MECGVVWLSSKVLRSSMSAGLGFVCIVLCIGECCAGVMWLDVLVCVGSSGSGAAGSLPLTSALVWEGGGCYSNAACIVCEYRRVMWLLCEWMAGQVIGVPPPRSSSVRFASLAPPDLPLPFPNSPPNPNPLFLLLIVRVSDRAPEALWMYVSVQVARSRGWRIPEQRLTITEICQYLHTHSISSKVSQST